MKNSEESGEQLAVHFIDVDYFKHINDTLGYQVGDSLLRGCASRLKQILREDLFIARMTSDEFLVLQRKVSSEQDVCSLAQQVIEQFRKPLMVDGYEIYTTVSIGISLYPQSSAATASELIEHADSAMHVIKEESRNDYKIFKQSLKEGFKERLKLETELHKAIKSGDFELHFQPQYELESQEIIGFEALCRWPHKEMGDISPDQFIPIAEKTGLILDIGDWVIYEACRLNKKWQDEDLPKVKVSVNLSARQFLQRHLVSRVSEILEETGLEPQYLELEITESMAMSNERYIIDTLHDFDELGVKVALDDFGTGYSSLKYLSQFPLSKIKIDRMFIQNQTKQNIAIVKTIIHLSHALNLKVIAEGVEKEGDLHFLLGEKCDQVQGFYFSKPMPESEIETFLNE
ncbi:diguanylate cyclase (GGDEF)-like protein [Alkalibacillus filiformis]|uniref:Diguanylate cyclase (GGDEF)-like protein n=1 Tax=Alkalibacillus filiformis TaxID=200990 RepID=A0ABU0DPP9_9BACI|nr:bifunctional diguanylate cyclase/phosphodiesterase [Alkalibacillus filiformis]MDQ0350419.1 diguanylate cyclase (GGDEF)-like protein [Alkalibacillus filiformis]